MLSPEWPYPIALFHGPNIPGSYATLFFTALDFISIIGHVHIWALFFFGSISSFFLELFLHWSPIAYWAPTDLGSSSFSVLSFCLFILFMGFSRQEYWSGLHSLLHWTTFCQTSPPWLVRLGWPHMAWLSFIELGKTVVSVIRLASFLWLWFQCVCPLLPSCNTYHLTWIYLTIYIYIRRQYSFAGWYYIFKMYIHRIQMPRIPQWEGIGEICD